MTRHKENHHEGLEVKHLNPGMWWYQVCNAGQSGQGKQRLKNSSLVMRDDDDGLLATAAASKLLSTGKSSLQHNKANVFYSTVSSQTRCRRDRTMSTVKVQFFSPKNGERVVGRGWRGEGRGRGKTSL